MDSNPPRIPVRQPRSSLVDAARRGSVEAKEVLYRLCARSVESYLRTQTSQKLRRYISISDLCQEAFLRAFRGVDALDPDASLSDFRRLLFRHALWVTQKHGRRAGQYAGEIAGEALEDSPERGASNSGEVTKGDELAWMRTQVDRLDPKYAEVLALRIEGRATDAIAAELGLNVHTVRKRILRGAQRLRTLTGNEGPSSEASAT